MKNSEKGIHPGFCRHVQTDRWRLGQSATHKLSIGSKQVNHSLVAVKSNWCNGGQRSRDLFVSLWNAAKSEVSADLLGSHFSTINQFDPSFCDNKVQSYIKSGVSSLHSTSYYCWAMRQHSQFHLIVVFFLSDRVRIPFFLPAPSFACSSCTQTSWILCVKE